jgi:drug/metabolite transporter (DMT)-like permease
MNGFMTILYSLVAALFWGAGDFSGGLATKRSSPHSVVIVSQMLGVGVLTLLALSFEGGVPAPDDMMWGGLAGVFGGTGLVVLYHGLAQGRMGVVAPVAGVVTVIVPVIVGMLSEGFPGILRVMGFGFALVAVWYVSRTDGGGIRLGELKLPILAGMEFGIFMIFMDRAGETSVFWPLVAVRVASISVLLIIATVSRQSCTPAVGQLKIIALAGLFDTGGNALFILATQSGRLDIAAILSGLYPAATVLLAWLILKEKINRQQWLGVLFALLAIVLIAA